MFFAVITNLKAVYVKIHLFEFGNTFQNEMEKVLSA